MLGQSWNVEVIKILDNLDFKANSQWRAKKRMKTLSKVCYEILGNKKLPFLTDCHGGLDRLQVY